MANCQPLAMLALLVVAFAAAELVPVSGSRPGLPGTSAADQQSLCSMTRDGLNSCKASLGQPKPAPACCAALGRANLTCLCSYKAYLPMLGINSDQAMELPGKCNLQKPDDC